MVRLLIDINDNLKKGDVINTTPLLETKLIKFGEAERYAEEPVQKERKKIDTK